jgi:anti-sigma B factor antagonist
VSVEIVVAESADIVRITGSIDAKTAPEIGLALQPALGGRRDVVVDFTSVDYVSSAGLRLLLVVYRKMQTESRRLVLAAVKDDIKQVMSHTGFLPFFTLAASESDALATLSESR